MQNLLLHLYQKHIHSKDPNSVALCKQQPLQVHTLSQQQLEFYSTMLIRNLLVYSPTSMELRLSAKGLLGFMRLWRFQSILAEWDGRGGKAAVGLLRQWIDNQMMPFCVDRAKVPLTCPYVYVDYKEEGEDQRKGGQMEPEVVEKSKTKKSTKKEQKASKKKQQSPSQTPTKKQSQKQIIMINIPQLTTQLQNQILTKEPGLNLKQSHQGELKNSQKRTQAIVKYQQIKIQQFLAQRFNTQTMMAYNFIQKYPFIDQKTLLAKTMLSAIELRKCLAILISEGFINFYPENSRSMLYRVLDADKMRVKYCDHVAQCMLNILVYLGRGDVDGEGGDGEKKWLMRKTFMELDQILMIFMA